MCAPAPSGANELNRNGSRAPEHALLTQHRTYAAACEASVSFETHPLVEKILTLKDRADRTGH